MAIPNVTFNFPANGLGNTPPSPSGIIAVVGPTSIGTAGSPTSLGGNAQNVVDVFGYGPAADLASNLVQGGSTVVVCKTAATAGVVGSVTHTGTGVSVMTVTGNSFDRYDVIVTVVRAGTAGSDPEPGFTVSLDNGRTTSNEIRMPADRTYEGLQAQCGIVLNFTAATLVVGDTYTFSAAAPTSTAAQVVTALAALQAGTEPFSYVYVTGAYDAADCVTINTKVGTMRDPGKVFAGLILESVDSDGIDSEATWMADLSADFDGTFQSNFASIAAGYIPVQSAVLGSYLWRSIGWLAAVRMSLTAVSRDLAAVADGALTPYKNASASLAGRFVPSGHFVHNENATPGLDADKFMTIRSFPNLIGFYITNPRVMSGPTSDYRYIQYVRVVDEAARLADIFWTQQLSADVLLNPSNGRILEVEAKKLESGSDEAMSALVRNQNVSALATQVARDDEIINTETLTVTIQIVPKGYIKQIPITVTFTKSLSR